MILLSCLLYLSVLTHFITLSMQHFYNQKQSSHYYVETVMTSEHMLKKEYYKKKI